MAQLHNPWVRLLLTLALAFVAVFGVVQAVWAAEIIEGDTIAAGEVIEDDVIISGEDVVIDGTVDGDLLAFGNTVTINGQVSGSLIVVGQEVFINGEVGGTVYSAGARLELGSSADTKRNVYFAGVRIVTDPDSTVGRDLNTVAVGAQFSGQVGRDLNALIGIVELVDKIRDAVTSETSEMEGAVPAIGALGSDGGVLAVMNPAGKLGPGHAASAFDQPHNAAHKAAQADSGIDWDKIGDWIVDRLVQLVVLFIFGGLALWLIPTQFDGWAEAAYHKPLPSAGSGLLTFVVGYAGAALLAVLLFAGGLFLGIAVAWELALSLWALGYSSLILAFVVFVLFVSYVSKAILAYLGGKLILDRVPADVPGRKVLALLLGLVLYVLIVAIPTLGPIIAFVVTILGLGAVWVAWLEGRRRHREQETYEKLKADLAALPGGAAPNETSQGVTTGFGVVSAADARLKDAMELGRQQAEREIQSRINDLGKQNGPWTYNEALGGAASTPFDRALLAVTGILGASREQNVYYFAAEDSDGGALRADTEYKITGKDLPARWWSITAYDPLYLIPNEQKKYSINKTMIATDEDGNWEAYLTSEPREDENWIHSGGGEANLLLALRLYNPSPEVVEEMGAVELPEILPVIEEVTDALADISEAAGKEEEPETDDAVDTVRAPRTKGEPDSGVEIDADKEGDEADE